MREILEQMLASDLLLFSFPLYCCGMPAMLKNIIERTLPLSSMAMAEMNGRRNFEPAVRQFELMFPNNHTILTVPESPMLSAPEAAAVTVPRLERVKKAGRQFAETGEIDPALLAEIASPMIPEDTYARIVNGNV